MPFDSTLADTIGTLWRVDRGRDRRSREHGYSCSRGDDTRHSRLYAGTTGELSVAHVILAAMIGAIAGDNVGFWIGRTVGFRWVVRHRSRLRLTTRRLKLGQYLFLRHGGKVVFFGRFVAVLSCIGWVVGRDQLHDLGALPIRSTYWAASFGLARTASAHTRLGKRSPVR